MTGPRFDDDQDYWADYDYFAWRDLWAYDYDAPTVHAEARPERNRQAPPAGAVPRVTGERQTAAAPPTIDQQKEAS